MKKSHYINTIQRIIDEIENYLTEEIKISDLALKSGYSKWEFQRIFSSMVGESMGSYLRHRRLSASLERLQNSNDRILDIALDYQFGSQESYSRAFKTYFRKTPNQIRKERIKVLIKNKVQITPELLSHHCNSIKLIPKIETVPKMLLIGYEKIIPSIYSNYNNYDHTLREFWQKFLLNKDNIKNVNLERSIGLAKCDKHINDDELLAYLACSEVSSLEEIPEGMVHYELSESTYAIFTNIGTGNKTSFTVNYIYGTWLPQSGYKRADGDDFEVFDHRYIPDSPDSISDYYLPISRIEK